MKPDTEDSGDFAQASYERHARHFELYQEGGERAATGRSWFRDDTIDAWRHRRMYAVLDPILATYPGATWVTVGDGRAASDARYLKSRGADVLATDISEAMLKVAKEGGYIDRYKVENAEALSFSDRSFDFVFCKESYHHFPRPAVALYEMLRVARIATVLIEPADHSSARTAGEGLFVLVRSLLGPLLRRPRGDHEFEDTGNYAYALSRREVEKTALALNLRQLAFAGLNDAYTEGVGEVRADQTEPLFRKTRRRIQLRDALARVGLVPPALLVAVIFAAAPRPALIPALRAAGYEIVTLPPNPYA